MAKAEEFHFLSADGKTKIHGMEWIPEDGKVTAVLQITHGMVEYIERYIPFAEYLTGKGFAVVGHDHIGHGESVASEEQWGIMDTDHPSDVMVEDMYTDFTIHRAKYPDVPYFILGHSMGSYMLRKYLSVYEDKLDKIDGAIIMGTGTEPDMTISMGKMIVRVIAAFKSWKYRSSFVAGLMFGAPYKVYDVTGANPEKSWLSKNIESVTKYYKDPKCTYMFSLGGYKALLEATGFDNKQENINRIPKELPILFTSGADDPVGNFGKGVQQAYDKFITAGMTDVAIKLYENDRHEILNELDAQTVFEDIYNWMMKKTK